MARCPRILAESSASSPTISAFRASGTPRSAVPLRLKGFVFLWGINMADRHASHQASELAAANVAVKGTASRRPYRLGGLLRWGEAGGWRLARRAVALVTAGPVAPWAGVEKAPPAGDAPGGAGAPVAAHSPPGAGSPARRP